LTEDTIPAPYKEKVLGGAKASVLKRNKHGMGATEFRETVRLLAQLHPLYGR